MPGDDRHKIEKGAALDVDSLIMDLEDGAALNRKVEARKTITDALRTVDFGRAEKLVRINPVDSPLAMDDLTATFTGHPDGYVLPKVNSAEQVQTVSARLSALEETRGWQVGAVRLLAIIETALGVVNLRQIAQSSPRLDALIFGAEDLAGDIGAARTAEGLEVFYARSAVVLYAKAFGLDAIDTPFVDLNNLDGLAADTRRASGMGYTGKLAIHPRQVAVIQGIFTPDTEAIRRAKRLVETHKTQQKAGRGAFELDGKMVDMPMVRAAETILARAAAAGINIEEV
jgi:citrate lyase beta subunit